VNNAVVPLPTCQNGPGGSCGLVDFTNHVRARGEFLGDFSQRCGLGNASSTGVPDVVDFYVNPFDSAANVSRLDIPVF
jgi:hypothetical protein